MGEITYRKRGSKWEYRFEGAKIDGKRNQISKGGFKTKTEAVIAATDAHHKYHNAGVVIKPTELSVSDYLDYWFDNYVVVNLRGNTMEDYIATINNHLKPKFGGYYLKSLSTTAIQEYTNDLKKQGYARSTVVGIISTLSGALEYAISPLGYIQNNPCDKVKYPKFQKKSNKGHFYIEQDTFNQVLELFKNKPYFFIPLLIGYYCGLRIGEVFGLTWDDINFEDKTITVNQQIIKRNFGVDVRESLNKKGKKMIKSLWYVAPVKTESSYRTISINDLLVDELKKLKQWQNENKLKYGEYYTEHYLAPEKDEKGDTINRIMPVSRAVQCKYKKVDLLTIRENGEYISTDSFKYASRVIHSKITKDFDFHSLRHTHATMLAEAGANPVVVQRRLGHADIKVTLQFYTHATEKLEGDMMKRYEQLFDGGQNNLCGQAVDKTKLTTIKKA